MNAPIVTCENLVKIYKTPEADIEVIALQGLDLEVQAGELVAMVGQSGSGKTTLLNILGALDQPSAGRVSVAGVDLTRLKEREIDEYRRLTVGHIWQQVGRNLAPDLSLIDNVSLPQTLAGVSSRERARRSARLLEQVGLAGKEARRPDQLSGGEQQRGAIAMALANGPRVLLADEPTGELDSRTARDIIHLLRQLTSDWGLTVVLVTHDRAAAAEADRVIAIRDGRTSTETVRRAQSLGQMAPARPADSAVIGLSYETHQEALMVDRAGRLQLPAEALERIAFDGRGDLRAYADHMELWPLASAPSTGGGWAVSASAVIGLPPDLFHEAVFIDRAGWLQAPEAALARVQLGRRALVRIGDDHVELWPGRDGEGVEATHAESKEA